MAAVSSAQVTHGISAEPTMTDARHGGMLAVSKRDDGSAASREPGRAALVAGEAVCGGRDTHAAGAHAVDGTLSLSIRPAGWTQAVFGVSRRRLGAGTGGHVDLHVCGSTNKVVAVKTLQIRDEDRAGGGILGRRVLEELGIAANVRHANIVGTHAIIVEPGPRCYVVMEACGDDLLAVLQRRAAQASALPAAEANAYFAQLVRGVHYLHARGIAHRDLKLDNICVGAQGELKIVDFGCATLFRRRQGLAAGTHGQYVETQSSGVCGSDPYMAPELLAAPAAYAAAKVDVWALGIVYFAMRHLQFPWAAAAPQRDRGFAHFQQAPARFFGRWFGAEPTAGFLTMTQHACTAGRSAQAVMARVLEADPGRRASIDEVVGDPWVQSIVCAPGR
ncbi:hypothetical protein H4S01_004973 [Coemansia sp. RSA 2610]|nr:hypothetical protein IWW54_004939 [Coemansia sp. RSA 2705]KAJ2362053.1 hypothetical protein H4S01_004973 [Coemansia sp. RSA 2610]